MRRELERLLIVVGSVLMLSGCGNTDAAAPTATAIMRPTKPAATTTPTASPSPTLTQTPSSTPTITPTAGPSPTPAPTPVFGSARVGNDFLFGNQPEGCELPCWQGLVVGQSDTANIQAMFDTAFGFDGSKVFESRIWESDTNAPPGLVNTYHLWTLREAEYWNDEFLVELWIREDRRILEAIRIDAEGNEFEPYSSPQQILRGLGVPSIMKVYIQQSAEDPRWGTLDLSMMYGDTGITVDYADLISITPDLQGNDTTIFCLDRMQGPHYTVDVYITEPFPSAAKWYSRQISLQ